MWFYSRVGAIKMGGFTVGYINNLYIGGKRNGAKLNLCLKEATLTHVGGERRMLVIFCGLDSIHFFFFCIHM